MRLRTVAAIGLVAAAFMLKPGAVLAETGDPETRKLAQQLVDLTVTLSFNDMMVGGSWPAVEQMIRQSPARVSDDDIAKLKADFLAILRAQMKAILADTPELYAKYFTTQELGDMLAFYETETGRKTVAVTPAMTAEIMKNTNERAPAMMQRIMASFQEILKERGIKTP